MTAAHHQTRVVVVLPQSHARHDYLSVATHVAMWGILVGALCVKLHRDINLSEGVTNPAQNIMGISDA